MVATFVSIPVGILLGVLLSDVIGTPAFITSNPVEQAGLMLLCIITGTLLDIMVKCRQIAD